MSRAILLVEDNPSDEKLTLEAFKQSKLVNTVHVVRDGAEALEYFFGSEDDETSEQRAASALPAVVLLDLNLPLIGGMDVLRRLRSDPRTKLLPVVVLTSSQEDEDVVGSYALGANAYVRKPVDFNEFIEAAKNLGLFWLLVNQPPPSGTDK